MYRVASNSYIQTLLFYYFDTILYRYYVEDIIPLMHKTRSKAPLFLGGFPPFLSGINISSSLAHKSRSNYLVHHQFTCLRIKLVFGFHKVVITRREDSILMHVPSLLVIVLVKTQIIKHCIQMMGPAAMNAVGIAVNVSVAHARIFSWVAVRYCTIKAATRKFHHCLKRAI